MKVKLALSIVLFTLVLTLGAIPIAEGQAMPTAELTVTKTGTPSIQPAPGTITWNITVTNTGDVTLTGINVTDSKHGFLGFFGSLAPGAGGFFTIVESGLPSGTYTDQAFAAGYYAPENLTVISWSDVVECVVRPVPNGSSVPEFPVELPVVTSLGFALWYSIRRRRLVEH